MSEKLFSVIIPSYNGMESIHIALKSLEEQTYRNIEVIVSDDNGPGTKAQLETEKIVNSFKKRLNVRYLANEHVNGSNARNKGLEIASGDYISFLDDDDFYLENYVEKAVKTFEENKDTDILFFNVAFISREGVSRVVENDEIDAVSLLFGDKEIGTGSNICIRRKIADRPGIFDIRYLRYQDIEYVAKKLNVYKSLWIKELLIVKYFNVNENYLNYRKALNMQKLLRQDMHERNIIDAETEKKLENRQLHTLFNDMLVKNMKKEDVQIVYGMLKEKALIRTIDRLVIAVYSISPVLFNLVYRTVFNGRNREVEDVAAGLLKKRNEIEARAL